MTTTLKFNTGWESFYEKNENNFVQRGVTTDEIMAIQTIK